MNLYAACILYFLVVLVCFGLNEYSGYDLFFFGQKHKNSTITVEPLYNGHLKERRKCPLWKGDRYEEVGVNLWTARQDQEKWPLSRRGRWREVVVRGEGCSDELGMKSKRIPDENITASSSKSKDNYPHFARLDSPKAWCSAPDDKLPYIQIRLKETKIITGITTQGSSSDWAWVTKYRVKFWENGTWKEYPEELAGNNNIRGVKSNALDPPIRAQSIRVYPKDPVTLDNTDPKPYCLRLELRGCSAPDCGPLQKPDHGDIIEQVAFTYGNSIVFKCTETGYEMKGSKIRTCQSDGTWSGSPTTCEIVQCGNPGTFQNGSQTVTKGFVYGGSVEFKCNKGYTLVGTRIIYCQANKQWSAAVPQCRDFCQNHATGVHANPDNCFGFIMCDKAGTTYEMSCPAGLKFNPATLVCDWPNNVQC